MKAAVFKEVGAPLAIEQVPVPEMWPHELLLKVNRCGVCGSDLHVVAVEPNNNAGVAWLPPDTVMGHEFSGTVVEVGAAATGDFRPGDRVTALPAIGCGTCGSCLAGYSKTCPEVQGIGFGEVPGANAEYVRVGAQSAFRLPDNVSDRDGAMIEPLAVTLNSVNKAGMLRGDNVLVIGGGPIGLFTAQWAKFFGARHVVVSDPVPERRALARAFGATCAIDPNAEAVAGAFKRIAGSRPQVIFECVGLPGIIQQCMDIAPLSGRIVVVGVCMHPDTTLPTKAVTKELTVIYTHGLRADDFRFSIDMLAQGRIVAEPMVTAEVGMNEFPAMFDRLLRPSAHCKVMLDPSR